MGRPPCCAMVVLNRGKWKCDEDLRLCAYIQTHGEGRWSTLPYKAGLRRCGKSCRLRWKNYLRPDVKRGHISLHEQDLILRLYRLLGNRWNLIAGRIPGRTDNEIKNFWNTHLKKRLTSQGIDPRTHKPLSESSKLGVSSRDGNINRNPVVDNVKDFEPSQESTGETETADNVNQSKCNQISEKSSHPFPEVMDSFQDQRTCITETPYEAFINNSFKESCQIVRPDSQSEPLNGQLELSNVSCVSGDGTLDKHVMPEGLKALGMEVQISEMMPPSVADFNEWFEDPDLGFPYPTTTTPLGSAYGDCSSDMFSSFLESFIADDYHFSDTAFYNTKCTT